MSLQCTRCGSNDSSVVDSRSDGGAIRRRRECEKCGYRFTTFERLELSIPMVIKKDGRREAFDREKVRVGIVRACEKRPVSMEQIDQVVEGLERRLHELCEKEIQSRLVGDFMMEDLKRLDQVAYIRFASVYREFSDVNQFADTLKSLEKEVTPPGRRKKNVPPPIEAKAETETKAVN